MDLRERIIESILIMKNGNENCTPQPDAARAELAYFNELLPHLNLNDGIRAAMGVKG